MEKLYRTPRLTLAFILALCSVSGLRGQEGAPPVSLTGLALSPSHPTVTTGSNQQFTATGTFSDSSSRALTGGGGVWETRANIPTASSGIGAAFVNGRLFAISGNPLARVVSYDPATDAWTTNTPIPEIRAAFGTAVAGGKIYVIGGDTGDPGNHELRDTVLIYDPAQDSWSIGAPMPGGPRVGVTAAVLGGAIYAVGGFGANNSFLTTVEVYDPVGDAWSTNPPMAVARFSAGVGAINGLLYVAGGDASGTEGTLEIYDPVARLWSTGASLPTARGGPATVLGGRLYVAGGGLAPRDSVLAFDPAWNIWMPMAPMNVGREELGAAVDATSGKLYTVSGSNRSFQKALEVFTPPEVFWHSTVPNVASVDSNGLATAISEGQTVIAAAAGTTSNSTTLTVVLGNTPPMISDVANQTTAAGTPTVLIPFTIGDAETAADSLGLSASSANTNLVPNEAIVLGGSGANRTVRLTPDSHQTGSVVITLTVSDGALTASDSFDLMVTAAIPQTDALFCLAAKGQKFVQTNSSATAVAAGLPFTFLAQVTESATGSLNSATLRAPNSSVKTLLRDGTEFAFKQSFSSKSALDTALPTGTYTFTLNTAHDGQRSNAVVLPADAYPATPRLVNWNAAQGIDAKADFGLEWEAFAGGGSGDFIQLTVSDAQGQEILRTADIFAEGHLDGTATSFVLASNALAPSQTYTGRLVFAKVSAPTTNGYPDVPGYTAYFKETSFTLVTLDYTPPQGRLRFSAAAYTAGEGQTNGTFVLTRLGGSSGEVSVQFTTGNGTATGDEDFVPTAGPLTLADGETTATYAFPILNDSVVEGNETVMLSLHDPSGGAVLGSPSNAVLTIVDDDFPSTAGTLQFSATNYTATESGPAVSVVVTRTGGSTGIVTVDYAGLDGTATAGQDFTNATGTLVFSNGVISRTFSVTVLNDTVAEGKEAFSLRLSHPTGGAALGLRNTTLVTITDNDIGGVVKFSSAAYSVSETNRQAVIAVTRTGGQASAVTVDLLTRNGSATADDDYVSTNAQIAFGAGEATKTISVPIRDDALAEGNETILLTLTNLTGGATLGSPSNAVLTIVDDEIALQFSAAAYTVSEAGPMAAITVARSGPANVAVTVNYATSNGTAQAGEDYRATNGILRFAAGALTQTFRVPILNDTLVESNETVILGLSQPTGAQLGPRSAATLTILENDLGGTLGFKPATLAVMEAAPVALVTVTRTGGSASGVTAAFATVDGTARAGLDYVGTNGTLTFGAGVMARTIAIPLLNDALDETNETFQVQLSNVAGGATLGPSSNLVVTIKDDDMAGTLKFSAPTYTVSESNAAVTITVTRSGGAAGGVTVDFLTAGGSATAGSDFTPTSGTLIFGAKELSKSFTIPISNDTEAEGNETVTLLLANATGGAVLAAPASATLTILDDETAVQFGSATYTVSESGPTATITVTRSGPAGLPFTVAYATSNGTATAGADYTAKTGTLNFAAGMLSQSFTVPILNDTLAEGNETVILTLSAPSNGVQLGLRQAAVLTILDNDLGGALKFSAATYSVSENGPTALITVTRTGGMADGVAVSFATQEGTATAGSDYVSTNGVLNFGSSVLSRTFTVPILNDTLHETNKTVNLLLFNPVGGASLGSVTNAVLTIIDNDAGQ